MDSITFLMKPAPFQFGVVGCICPVVSTPRTSHAGLMRSTWVLQLVVGTISTPPARALFTYEPLMMRSAEMKLASIEDVPVALSRVRLLPVNRKFLVPYFS